MILDNFIEGFLCVILLTIGSILTKKIDILGAIVGGLLTLLMFLGFNFAGIGLIFIFFVLGSKSRCLCLHKQRLYCL